ncbi:GATOR complex protein MIOS [Gryllus bimaculatus]|nr:GATOR complex protein MIOS [Gryllus bimaculatus]
MNGVKLEVQWSPVHVDKFITWGTEIFLYEIIPQKDALSTSITVSDTTAANLLASNSSHHYVKCVDIYPQAEPDLLLAIGQANGKVVLTTFGPTTFDSRGLPGKELTPRHARQCNAIAWNPFDTNLIVAGLDKYRAEHSILVWDVFKCSHHVIETKGSSFTSSSQQQSSSVSELARPVYELGMSEIVNSLAWFNFQPRSIIVGMNNKHLRMIDLRDTSRTVCSTPTKAVYGLAVDPHNDCQLASYYENQISIWDTRNFEKPVLTVTQGKPVTKVLWCPTRHSLLGSLVRDSCGVYLHDIRHTIMSNDEVEPSVLERCIQPCASSNITSFSWHPSNENRMLTISLTGTIKDYVVFERITLNSSPNSAILWSYGRRSLRYVTDKDSYIAPEDISVKIKRRALNGYGLKAEFSENGDISEDVVLKRVWKWLTVSQSLSEDSNSSRGPICKYPGVRHVLRMDGNFQNGAASLKSELNTIPWADLCNGNGSMAKIYKSEDRDKALLLCGWKVDREPNALTSFLSQLESEGSFSRAAAIAVFNLKLRLAVSILNRGAAAQEKTASITSNLNIVAMAVSGFSDDKSSMWRELCLTSRSQLVDPYLRAMFAFLTADDDNFDNVLNENGVAVEDRVAFACMFLSDAKLNEYVHQLMMNLIAEGDLAGILLTGNSNDSVLLLQSYLEATGDIQSVCVIAIRMFPSEVIEGTTVQMWITSYCMLLDSWHLWNQRAQFDILLSMCTASEKPPQQVFISCNFCGKSISAQMQGHSKGRGSYVRLGASSQKLKMSSCPQCRKPLPRCAICLVNMGTPSGLQNNNNTNSSGRGGCNNKLAEFSSWFTWCQSCRHGGHAAHMAHWFREHSECPVTACTCRCLSLDAASKVPSILSHQV